MDIRAEEGGDDARAFADELTEGYFRWLKTGILDLLAAGEGRGAFIIGSETLHGFEREAGLHCVQRVPRNERGGRVHTSYARVTITPLIPTRLQLDLEEVEITTQRGHGNGGQHQNKTDSAVRAVHKRTGISVFINGRKQGRNRQIALEILAERVEAHARKSDLNEQRSLRLGVVGEAKIRTYNLVENRAIDHRTKQKCYQATRILEGRFDLLSS